MKHRSGRSRVAGGRSPRRSRGPSPGRRTHPAGCGRTGTAAGWSRRAWCGSAMAQARQDVKWQGIASNKASPPIERNSATVTLSVLFLRATRPFTSASQEKQRPCLAARNRTTQRPGTRTHSSTGRRTEAAATDHSLLRAPDTTPLSCLAPKSVAAASTLILEAAHRSGKAPGAAVRATRRMVPCEPSHPLQDQTPPPQPRAGNGTKQETTWIWCKLAARQPALLRSERWRGPAERTSRLV